MCENEKKKTSSIEMTSGSLWKNILLFSLPLMIPGVGGSF